MKRALLILSLGLSVPALAADIGVSVSVGQPGFYGRIDIGDYPPPRVVYAEPVIIHRPPPRVVYEPIYVHVPSHHARDWRRYCGHYGYCGRPVYFVQDAWYHQHVARDSRRDDYRDGYREGRRDGRRDERRDDRRDERHRDRHHEHGRHGR